MDSSPRDVREVGKGARWYVVHAQLRREQLAREHLDRQGFETFCPLQRAPMRVGRHMLTRLRTFFPGYLFARLDLDRQQWRSINGTIGVRRLVGFGESGLVRPAPLPDGLIEHLRGLTSDEGELQFRERLAPGDAVRVMGGPFDRLCGVLESAGDQERVTILLDVLSKETRVRLTRTMLVAA